MSDPVSRVHYPSGRKEGVNVNSGLLLPWGPLDGSEQRFRLSSPLPESQVQVSHSASSLSLLLGSGDLCGKRVSKHLQKAQCSSWYCQEYQQVWLELLLETSHF